MVFESLVSPVSAERKPWEMFFVGMLYSSVAIILSLYVFRSHASLIAIFLTVLASTPLMYGAIKLEEKKDLTVKEEPALLKEHGRALSFFVLLFLGFMVSFSLWYIFLPSDVAAHLFETQISEIQKVNEISTQITGNAIDTGNVFAQILVNNMKVLLFCLLFAFFYGVGAKFILTWNASVIGAAIGNFVRSSIDVSYMSAIPLGLLRYSIHGIPEIAAYFTAGLAGGIISVAIIRHDFASDKFRKIIIDSTDLVLISIGMLIFAAIVEVFITPVFF